MKDFLETIQRLCRPTTLMGTGRCQRGMTLPTVLVMGLVMMVMVGGLIQLSTHQTRTRTRYEFTKDEFAAAELAMNRVYAHVQYLIYERTPNLFEEMKKITAPNVSGFTFPKFLISKNFEGMETIADGEWKGLTLKRLRYQIDVTAKEVGGSADRFKHPGVSLRQVIEITYVPLYNFAIFYDPDMEIAPGPAMEINGLVHCNGNAYFQSQNGLKLNKNVTIAGKFYRGRSLESGKTDDGGDVQFNDGKNLVSMKRTDSDGMLDSKDGDWAGAAQDRWKGGLRDRAHGVTPLSLPIPNTVDPHEIIERADQDDSESVKQEKFENKAGLKIVIDKNGAISASDSTGKKVELTYKDPKDAKKTKSVVNATDNGGAVTSQFYDAREGKAIKPININMANLKESGLAPANGIIYVSSEEKNVNPAVRLYNGAELAKPAQATGLTVATDLPMYIQGDFNTTNKVMSMVAADALTILSNSWSDVNSATSTDAEKKYKDRAASNTKVNAVCMQGIVPSANNNYSGGVENYFRLLENWGGDSLTFSGSLINMWESTRALGKWKYGGPVYDAPNRVWSWDTALGGVDGPPGAPYTVRMTRKGWVMP